MDITEIRIKLMDDPQERLQAFCSITFDHCFVIRDLKIIEGTKGSFVAMPSRKLTDRCPHCHTKNQLRALYCNQCGAHLTDDRAGKDSDGRAKLYADIAHPINSRCRELIQMKVMEAFHEEQIKARQPGYVCTYDDYGENDYDDFALPDMPLQTFTTANGDTHRVDPAVPTVTDGHRLPAPHFNVAADLRESDRRGPGQLACLRDSDEGFGAGID